MSERKRRVQMGQVGGEERRWGAEGEGGGE